MLLLLKTPVFVVEELDNPVVSVIVVYGLEELLLLVVEDNELELEQDCMLVPFLI